MEGAWGARHESCCIWKFHFKYCLAKCFLVSDIAVFVCTVYVYVRDIHVWVKQKPAELLRHGYGTTLCFYMHAWHMLHHVQLKTARVQMLAYVNVIVGFPTACGTRSGDDHLYSCPVSATTRYDFQYSYQLSNTLSRWHTTPGSCPVSIVKLLLLIHTRTCISLTSNICGSLSHTKLWAIIWKLC